MRILGIESSCDETAAAVVEDGRRILSNVVSSQIDIHAEFGGVVPEIAARSHIEVILPIIDRALTESDSNWDDIDAIAVTYTPGLIGSLLIGVMAARTLALLKHKPLIPVHHVEGHVYANFLLDTPPPFPCLALITSGLHSQLVLFKDHGDYEMLGQTQDDAVGEAFDKVAKMLGLPYPGGPSVSKAAESGNSYAFEFPKAKFTCPPGCTHNQGIVPRSAGKATASTAANRILSYDEREAQPITQLATAQRCRKYDFSFSGLKTAVLRTIQREVGVDHTFPSFQLAERLSRSQQDDIAASFQRVAVETLVEKTLKAYRQYCPASVVIAGGAAANQELRRQLADALPIPIEYAPMNICTDNGAMIATLGFYMYQAGITADPLELEAIPSLSMTKTAWKSWSSFQVSQ